MTQQLTLQRSADQIVQLTQDLDAAREESDRLRKDAEEAVKGLEAKDADSGKYYVKVMGKVAEKPDFVGKETERLQKMIDDGAVKANKKEQFGR